MPGRVSMPGDDGYAAATAIWAKPAAACRAPSSTAGRLNTSNGRFEPPARATCHYRGVAEATTGRVASSATGFEGRSSDGPAGDRGGESGSFDLPYAPRDSTIRGERAQADLPLDTYMNENPPPLRRRLET